MAIKGLKDIELALLDIADIDKAEVKKLVDAAIEPILQSAKSACPSNTVRNALKRITKNDKKYPTWTLIGVDSKSQGTPTITAPALASIIEYGSVKHKARPFMRPAFDKHQESARGFIEDGLVKILDKTIKKNNL